jgi:hypothetical protein
MWFGEADYTGACDRARDRDCDYWYDEHDNCPFVSNADQKTPDNLADWGPGALCALCPSDPYNDRDKDGVCGPPAPGFPVKPYARVDNCPVTVNSDQRNCNELSERTLSRKVLGDACDPVPCPKVDIAEGRAHVVSGLPFDPYVGFQGSGRIVRDTFTNRPVRPHRLATEAEIDEINRKYQSTRTPEPQNVADVLVANRFCQLDADARFFCTTASVIRNDVLDVPEVLDRRYPWHRIRTRAPAPFSPFAPPGTDLPWSFTGPLSPGATRVWGYQQDYTDWVNANLIPLPVGNACQDFAWSGAGTCLNGYLWHHARTNIGYTQGMVGSFAVGARQEDGSDLSNSFERLAPDEPFVLATKPIGKYRHLWWWQKLVDPLPPFLDDPQVRFHARLVGLDEDKETVLLHDMGSGEVADARLAEGARSHLREHFVAGSLEPEAAPRNLAREIEAAVLTNDGTQVLDLLVSHENRLEAGKDVGMSDTSGRSEQAPSPRHGFISFLSPALGGVVVAGGSDDRGKPTPSVHLYRLGMGWLTVNFPYELSDVRAAVYCPHDGMLWVLNARDEGTMEVVRMNPLTGEERRGGTFAWNPSTFDSYQLSLDTEGKVLLVASSATSSRTMRIEESPVDGELVGTGRLMHEHPQHMPPISAFGETSFVREDADGRIVGIDRSRNVPTGGTFLLGEMCSNETMASWGCGARRFARGASCCERVLGRRGHAARGRRGPRAHRARRRAPA